MTHMDKITHMSQVTLMTQFICITKVSQMIKITHITQTDDQTDDKEMTPCDNNKQFKIKCLNFIKDHLKYNLCLNKLTN